MDKKIYNFRKKFVYLNLHVYVKWTNFFDNSLALQVPYELLNKKFRSAQKTIDREVSKAQSAGSDLEACLQNQDVTIGEVTKVLDNMVEKLKFLKRKVFPC